MDASRRRRIVIFLLIPALLITVGGLWIRHRRLNESGTVIRALPVTVVRPERTDMTETLVLPAVLEARRTAIIVPRVGGLLVEVPVEEGDPVVSGDLLARIDPVPYELELRAAESQWRLAEEGLRRIEAVQGGTSRQMIDQARADRDAALTNFELAKLRAGYSDVRSPVGGRILRKMMDAGNMASPEQPIMVVGDDSVLRAEVRVPEKYWHRFADIGSVSARASFPSGGTPGEQPIRIVRIAESVNPEDHTFDVVCETGESGPPWPVGGRIEVTFILEEARGVWTVPLRALSVEGDLWRVDTETRTVSRVRVPVSFRDGTRMTVPADWSSDTFVLDGHSRVAEGSVVSPSIGTVEP